MSSRKSQSLNYIDLLDIIKDCIALLDNLIDSMESSLISSSEDPQEFPDFEDVSIIFKKINKIIAFDKIRNTILPPPIYPYTSFIYPMQTDLIKIYSQHNEMITKIFTIFKREMERYKQFIFPKKEFEERIQELDFSIEEYELLNKTQDPKYAQMIDEFLRLKKNLSAMRHNMDLLILERNGECIDAFFQMNSAIITHFIRILEYSRDKLEDPEKIRGSTLLETFKLEEKLLEDHIHEIQPVFSIELFETLKKGVEEGIFNGIIEKYAKSNIEKTILKSNFKKYCNESLKLLQNFQNLTNEKYGNILKDDSIKWKFF